MKKNRMMRIASVLLIAVLMSTYAISGTFAKYVTTVTDGDSARVAKWGITSTTLDKDAIFKAEYKNGEFIYVSDTDSNDEGEVADDVVAPGTSGTGTYALGGAPEVAYKITFDLTDNSSTDVFLKQGVYAIGTWDNSTFKEATGIDSYQLENSDYYPIKWQIQITTKNGTFTAVKAGTQKPNNNSPENKVVTYKDLNNLSEVDTALSATVIEFAPNANCDVELTITWDWAFEKGDIASTNESQKANNHIIDDADTILGYLATNSVAVKNSGNLQQPTDANYSLNVAYELNITATQITATTNNNG